MVLLEYVWLATTSEHLYNADGSLITSTVLVPTVNAAFIATDLENFQKDKKDNSEKHLQNDLRSSENLSLKNILEIVGQIITRAKNLCPDNYNLQFFAFSILV